jgi:ankyrin repeat protein
MVLRCRRIFNPRNHDQLLKMILTGEIYGTPVQAAALTGHLAVVKLLLSRGADANAGGKCFALTLLSTNMVFKGSQYGTALQAALYTGQVDIAKLLLKWNVNVNTKGEFLLLQ